MNKKTYGSWVNLQGGGQFPVKEGDGEQMCGMVPGRGSVSGCPRPTTWRRRAGFVTEGTEQGPQSHVVFRLRWRKEGFMSILNRNFVRLLMRGVFFRVCSGVLWG